MKELLKTVEAMQLQHTMVIYHEETTRELSGERDNARNNARCTQARKTTHSLDGQHQDVDRTHHGRGQYVQGMTDQPSDRGRLKNRTKQNCLMELRIGKILYGSQRYGRAILAIRSLRSRSVQLNAAF